MLTPQWEDGSEKNRQSMLIRFGSRTEKFPDGSLEALVEPHGDDIHWHVMIRCLCCDQDMMEPRYDVFESDIIGILLDHADY